MGREGDSRGTTQISRGLAGHFVPTNISLPCNAGIAVRTTYNFHTNNSRGNFGWFRTNATFSACGVASLWRLPPAYFPLSMFLMGSPVGFIICENEGVSRGGFTPLRVIQAHHKKDKSKRRGDQIQNPVCLPL